MAKLYDKIEMAIAREKVVFSLHADNRILERGIVRWRIVEGFATGELLQTHPAAQPNPKILIRQLLPDGTEVIAVWSFLESIRCAQFGYSIL